LSCAGRLSFFKFFCFERVFLRCFLIGWPLELKPNGAGVPGPLELARAHAYCFRCCSELTSATVASTPLAPKYLWGGFRLRDGVDRRFSSIMLRRSAGQNTAACTVRVTALTRTIH
jgi:hypothetical protein